jgi:hypothetical protein
MKAIMSNRNANEIDVANYSEEVDVVRDAPNRNFEASDK